MDQTEESGAPTIIIETEPSYVLGYPIVVAVVLQNKTTDTDFLDLPQLGLVFPIDSLAAVLEPVKGGATIELGPAFTFRDKDLFRTELMAGESKRMLVDLAQFGQAFQPGRYRLSLSIYVGTKNAKSSLPCEVDFIEPSPIEREEAQRLRRLGLPGKMVDTGSWQPFLTNNWNTVALSTAVGEKVSQQMALYLFLHRAAYGPEPLKRISLDPVRKLHGPVLAAEAAGFEYEILSARGMSDAQQVVRSSALQKWPGLKSRFQEIDQGQGLLTVLRTGYGVEKKSGQPQAVKPYPTSGRK